jgi:hypothetical protein
MDLSLGIIVLTLLVIIIVIIIIKTVWNILMPDIFGIKKITFLQTIGLLFLTNIFFHNSLNVSNIYISNKAI